MRWLRRFALFSFPVSVLFLPSCVNHTTGSTPGGHPNGTGPFDRNGNYVEAWADSPSKWGRGKPTAEEVASAAADTPSVSQSEEPPSDAVPLPAAGSSTVAKSAASPKRKTGEVEVASLSKHKAMTKSGRVRDEEDAPKSAKNRTRESATTAKSKAKAKHSVDDEPVVASKSKTKAAAESAKTKSKASASKANATKSKVTSHYTVKKGDNLTLIAKRNKTTVSAIQKANGLKGSTVVPGKTLVIPRS